MAAKWIFALSIVVGAGLGCEPADPIDSPPVECIGSGCPGAGGVGAGAGAGAEAQSAPAAGGSSAALDACVFWRRTDCNTFRQCFPDGFGCNDSIEEMRQACRDSFAEDGCENPNPEDYYRCAERISGETCDEYCPGDFCFSFCFYRCLD